MAPGSPSTPRGKAKRVSAQHTLERVRNNQRRHRARRKDYIATLEQKLSEAEQTILTLKDQVEALQASLTQYRRQPQSQDETDRQRLQPHQHQSQSDTSPPPLTDALAESVQAYGALSDTEDLGAWELLAPPSTQPLVSEDQPTLEVNALFSLPAESLQAPISSGFMPDPPQVTGSASNQADTESGSLLPGTIMQDQILIPTTPCCSKDPSSDSQPTVKTTNQMHLIPSQEAPLLLPGYVFQSAMEDAYQSNTDGESTMPCTEAYILVAQQNFKGMNHGDVAAWLWNGFRRALNPGEGCRVNTDTLFSLLAFISDT